MMFENTKKTTSFLTIYEKTVKVLNQHQNIILKKIADSIEPHTH